MPLEHILRAMQAQAENEIQEITRAADEEAAQLIAEANVEANKICARHRERVEPMLVAEAASLQNTAKLGALRAIANAREQLLLDAFEQAADCLGRTRESQEYPGIFRALAREATEGLAGDLTARVDPQDVSLARATFAEMRMPVEIVEVPVPLGGLEVMTRDGRVVIVNTLASRLERARGRLRSPVADILTDKTKSDQ